MKVKGRFDHFNIDVTNLEQSIRFYETALGLHLSLIHISEPTRPY